MSIRSISPFCRRVVVVGLAPIAMTMALAGCGTTVTDGAKDLNPANKPPANWAANAPMVISAYRDTTLSVQSSPHVKYADQEAAAQLAPKVETMHSGSMLETFTTASPDTNNPHLRFTAQIQGKLPAEARVARRKSILEGLASTLTRIENEPSETRTTPLVEDIYFLMDRQQRLPGAKDADRELEITSDMEPCSKDILTTSEIITADPTHLKAIENRVLKAFPHLDLAPHRVVIVLLPTQMKATVMPPAATRKLLDFWTALFTAWGVGKLEIVEPRSYSPVPLDTGSPSPALADKSGHAGPFEEKPGQTAQPSLSVLNGCNELDILTLTNGQGKTYTMQLPFQENVALSFPAGTYDGRLEIAGKGTVRWNGRARFKPYKRYSTYYVEGGNGSPLHFGEPD